MVFQSFEMRNGGLSRITPHIVERIFGMSKCNGFKSTLKLKYSCCCHCRNIHCYFAGIVDVRALSNLAVREQA